MNTQNRPITSRINTPTQQHLRWPTRSISQIEEVFHRLHKTPWWYRDPVRKSGSCEWSWIDIFQRDRFHCVFCDTNLAESPRTLAQRSIDHLIPKSFFQNEQEANRGCNLVTCCKDCNALKADWRPATTSDLAWKSRAAFIGAARRQIEAADRARYGSDMAILTMAAKGASLDAWSDERQPAVDSDRLDYLASPFAELIRNAPNRRALGSKTVAGTVAEAHPRRTSSNSVALTSRDTHVRSEADWR